MLRKLLLILVGGFAIQFLLSCEKCGPIPTFEMFYTGLSLRTGAEIDSRLNLDEDTIRTENFRLEIYLEHEQVALSEQRSSFQFGFNKANALDCPTPLYNYSDKLKDLNILMINQEDRNQMIDVTTNFGSNFNSEIISVKDLIEIQNEYQDQFSLDLLLVDYDSIYEKASFQVTATLESGETFTEETEEIIFVD